MLADAARLGAGAVRVLEAAATVEPMLLEEDARPAPRSNRMRQLGVVTASLMQLAALSDRGVRAVGSAGLSLGEYCHLVHIGALELEEVFGLVSDRGALYDAGPEGRMVAVFPIGASELARALDGIEGVAIATFNSPTQQVIAGPRTAVELALARLDAEHLVEAVVIEERIPMHVAAFEPVSRRLRERLDRVTWRPSPSLAYRPNVDAAILVHPLRDDYVERLTAHVHRPVRWRETIERAVAEAPDLVFVEVGPGTVLTGLLARRWLPNRAIATDGAADIEGVVDALRTASPSAASPSTAVAHG